MVAWIPNANALDNLLDHGWVFLSFLLSLGDWIFSRAGEGKQSWFLGKEVRKVCKLVSRSCRS